MTTSRLAKRSDSRLSRNSSSFCRSESAGGPTFPQFGQASGFSVLQHFTFFGQSEHTMFQERACLLRKQSIFPLLQQISFQPSGMARLPSCFETFTQKLHQQASAGGSAGARR